MLFGTATKWPMILAFRFLDWQVINGGKAKSHQAIAIKLPVLVAIGAEPIPRIIMPFIGEPHGDAVCVVSPKLFDQPVVEFFGPLAFQKLDDLGSSSRELGAVSPAWISRIGESHLFRITRISSVFGRGGFFNGRFTGGRGEGRAW